MPIEVSVSLYEQVAKEGSVSKTFAKKGSDADGIKVCRRSEQGGTRRAGVGAS